MSTSSDSTSSESTSTSSESTSTSTSSQRRKALWGRIPDDELPVQFSIRPSVLSPLHPIYRENAALEKRLEFLGLSAEAQMRLSEEIDGGHDESTAHAALSKRRETLRQLTNAFHAASEKSPLPPPADPGAALGYMAVLQTQLAEKESAAAEFQRVLNGERDIWDYWFNDFAPQFEGLPGLAPLDMAFSRPSSLEEAQALKRRAMRMLVQQGGTERRQPRLDVKGRARATGKRKTAVARVFIWEGRGRVMVNRQPIDQYFGDWLHRAALLKPLMATGALQRFDVAVQVEGSGRSGQAQAAAHGVARALQNFDPAAYRAPLKRSGMLKRDPRMVERKKPGKAKARKSFTWVKR